MDLRHSALARASRYAVSGLVPVGAPTESGEEEPRRGTRHLDWEHRWGPNEFVTLFTVGLGSALYTAIAGIVVERLLAMLGARVVTTLGQTRR